MTAIRSERLAVTYDPQRGCRITGIHVSGVQENLLVEEVPGREIRLPGGQTFPVAGWIEAFPSIEQFGPTPTMGSIWRRTPAWTVDADAASLRCRWEPEALRLDREIVLRHDRMTVSYRAKNLGSTSRCVLWAAHPLFSLHRMKSLVLSSRDGVHRVPVDRIRSSRIARFNPEGAPTSKTFLPGEHRVDLVHDSVRLSLTTDAPWWGMWFNLGRAGVRCIGVEATNVASDSARDADPLEPGSELHFRWDLSVVSNSTGPGGSAAGGNDDR